MRVPWIGVGRLALTGALVAGLCFAASSRADRLDLSGTAGSSAEPSGTAPKGTVDTVPTRVELTCVGPELSGLTGVADVAQSITAMAGQAPPAALADVLGTRPTGQGELSMGSIGGPTVHQDAATVTTTLTGATWASVQGSERRAPGVAAAQEWSADTPELRGLVTSACAREGDDLWLVAGAGAPGRQERLVLANSGANEVSVDVSVLGDKGPIASPNGRGIVVPGRGRTSVLLDAIAGGEPSPAVHVQVKGGAVAAALSDVWLDGSVPAGAETVTPSAPAATRLVLPGVNLTQPGSVRVVVPGPTQAVVKVRVLTKDGGAPLPGGGVALVPASSVAELALADLPADTYAVEVVADVPVIAAAFVQAREGAGPGDFAWAPSAPVVRGLAGLPVSALPAQGSRTLVLAASEADVRVTIFTGSPDAPNRQQITLGVDRIATVDVGSAVGGVWLRGDAGQGELRAALLSMTGTGPTRMMSVVPLTDTLTTTSASRTYPLP